MNESQSNPYYLGQPSFPMLVFQTKNFTVDAPDYPLVDRGDGGHLIIDPIQKIRDRQQLSPALAIELMRLTIVVGEAMTTVLNNHGVDVGRINYQDNGNWSVFKPDGPFLHIHLYGRAKSAKIQAYGHTLYFPHRDQHSDFYKDTRPLNSADIEALGKEIVRLLSLSKYSDAAWRI